MARDNKKRAIGMIIDAAQIRAVELSGSKKNPTLEAYGWVPMPEGLMKDGILTDIPKAARLLGDLWKNGGFSDAPVVIGAKNQNVLMRLSSFPKAPADKMDSVIRYQAQQAIPIPVSDLVLDYLLCDETSEEGRSLVNVLLVGARRDFVENTIALAKAAKRVVADIDVTLLAAHRTATDAMPSGDEVFLLADIDYETISMLICKGKTVLMTRTVPIPSVYLENVKKRYQLVTAVAGNDVTLSQQGETDEFLKDNIQQLADQLVGDLRTSISFFSTQRSINVDKIILSGPMSGMENLADVVAQEFYIPVEAPLPYPGLLQTDPRYYANCVSLAIRGLGE